MRVLILGGTGAMGVHLAGLLSGSGVETFVTSRKHRLSDGKVKYIQGNAHDFEFLQAILMEQWDAIVDFMVYTTSGFSERVHLLSESASQYLFLSSARIYAGSELPVTEASSRLLDVSEDREFLSTDEYALAKARQEDILINSGRKNWTIIRPYITYSENRLQLGVLEKEEWLYRALQGRTIIFSKDICARTTTLTYGFDVAKGIMALIGNPLALGETFHITTGRSHRWEDILAVYTEVLEKHLGYRPNVLLQDLEKFTECHPAKYQIVYDRLFNRLFDNSKIARYVNTDSFTLLEEGLKNCLEKFLADPGFGMINWKLEAIKDRQTSEQTPLKEIPSLKQKIKYLIFRYLFKS